MIDGCHIPNTACLGHVLPQEDAFFNQPPSNRSSLSLSLPLSYLRTLGRLADQLGFEARGLQCQECLERTSLKGPHPVPVPMDRVNIAYYARLGR